MGNALATDGHHWDPWRHLRRHYPHIPVICTKKLKGKKRGAITRRGILIDQTLGQAARRCTLTHEIIHPERGPAPRGTRLAAREEQTVRSLTARRLITLPALTEALIRVPPDDPHALAEELWVDMPTLIGEFAAIMTERRGSDLDAWIKHVRDADSQDSTHSCAAWKRTAPLPSQASACALQQRANRRRQHQNHSVESEMSSW
ncbi:hypothetical protein [Nocardia sp. NPDC004711]